MTTLQEILADNSRKKNLISDCVVLIDTEVSSKGGLSGIAVKTGYKVVKSIKPGFIEGAVEALLEPFADKLQPVADAAKEKGVSIREHFVVERSRVAEALLSVTDARADRSHHATVKSAYSKLRPSAKKHVEEAIPALGKLVEKHVGA